jgi:hypothetical protein
VVLVLQILWAKEFISYCFVTNSEVEESERGREGWWKVCITNLKFVLPPCAAVLCLRDRHDIGLSHTFFTTARSPLTMPSVARGFSSQTCNSPM